MLFNLWFAPENQSPAVGGTEVLAGSAESSGHTNDLTSLGLITHVCKMDELILPTSQVQEGQRRACRPGLTPSSQGQVPQGPALCQCALCPSVRPQAGYFAGLSSNYRERSQGTGRSICLLLQDDGRTCACRLPAGFSAEGQRWPRAELDSSRLFPSSQDVKNGFLNSLSKF